MNLKTVLSFPVAFLAISVLASCGGSKPSVDNAVEVMNPADAFTKMCRTELKDHLCGVGENTNSNAQIARDIATANARNELATKIKVSIESALKRAAQATFGEEGRETTFQRLVQEVSGEFANIEIYETKTLQTQDNRKTVYALVVIKKEDLKKIANNKASNAEILSDAAASKIFMDMIDEELNKAR
ncbi:MAG: LPP20 family lipoprotein [Fibromonadales bacterium]|nr:LPP20 family lipoprotein [Fibromonadales bacterium]